MPRNPRLTRALVGLFLLLMAAKAQSQPMPAGPVVRVETAWSAGPRARPGDQRALAVILHIREGFHINPAAELLTDATLIPTELVIAAAPAGLHAGPVQYSPPQSVNVRYSKTVTSIKAYEGRAILYVPVTVDPQAKPGPVTLKLSLTYQSCNATSCLAPQTVDVPVVLEVVTSAVATTQADNDLFAGFDYTAFSGLAGGKAARQVVLGVFGWRLSIDPSSAAGLAALQALAALGGLLLNLTPCVLPVIPIKIMGLSRAAGNRGRCLLLGAMVSLGVVAFWLGMGAVIAATKLALARGGGGVVPGWGLTSTNELFQMPWFTVAVGVLIGVMAMGMGGFFTIRLPRWVYQLNPQYGSIHGSLGFGVMTAVLSTPCTAPFMGGVAAWAVTQPPATILATFVAIGTGMALPYLLLSAFPRWVERMPRTGPASELIKQVMGILMLAAAAYFIGAGISGATAAPTEPPGRAYWWVVYGFIAAAGVWLAGRTFRITPSLPRRAVFGVLGLALLVGSVYGAVRATDRGPIDWVYYTPERFAQAQRQGKVVVMDFTAEWCLNCKVIEAGVLHSPRVVAALKHPGVTPMKVDLTGNNAAGNEMLRRVGRVMIPALAVFAPDGRQLFNSDSYTAEQVVEAVKAARQDAR